MNQTEQEYQDELESENIRHANRKAAEAEQALVNHHRAFAMLGAQRDADGAMHFGASREIVDRIRTMF